MRKQTENNIEQEGTRRPAVSSLDPGSQNAKASLSLYSCKMEMKGVPPPSDSIEVEGLTKWGWECISKSTDEGS